MEKTASHHVNLKIYHLVLASTSGLQKHLGQSLQVRMLKDNEEIPCHPEHLKALLKIGKMTCKVTDFVETLGVARRAHKE